MTDQDWVPFLRGITEDQIEKPHLWPGARSRRTLLLHHGIFLRSLVGRMSGMYDYIQSKPQALRKNFLPAKRTFAAAWGTLSFSRRNMWMTNNGFRDFLAGPSL